MSARKEQKKEMILDAALLLFSEKGYDNTKISEIADAAGIGKGTVYEYFDAKDTIFLELIGAEVKREHEKLSEIMTADLSCRDKLIHFFRCQSELSSRRNRCMADFKRQFLSNWSQKPSGISGAIMDLIIFQFECVHRVITEGIGCGEFRAVDPHAATTCFIGSLGLCLSMHHEEDPAFDFGSFERKNYLNKEDDVLDFIFNGLTA